MAQLLQTLALVSAIPLAFPLSAYAHMEMRWPYPFRSKFDPAITDPNYDNTFPLSSDGSNYPCQGFQNMASSQVSKVTYTPGQTYNISITGSAPHMGGSCQISLSYDNGQSFKVVKSMIGGCPLKANWDFTVPSNAPASDSAILAWTWFNLVGNREMYMNCARVTIAGQSVQRYRRYETKRQSSFGALPDVFTCNIGNGCKTIERREVVFPNPGPAIERNADAVVPDAGPGFVFSGAPTGDAFSSAAPLPSTTTGPFLNGTNSTRTFTRTSGTGFSSLTYFNSTSLLTVTSSATTTQSIGVTTSSGTTPTTTLTSTTRGPAGIFVTVNGTSISTTTTASVSSTTTTSLISIITTSSLLTSTASSLTSSSSATSSSTGSLTTLIPPTSRTVTGSTAATSSPSSSISSTTSTGSVSTSSSLSTASSTAGSSTTSSRSSTLTSSSVSSTSLTTSSSSAVVSSTSSSATSSSVVLTTTTSSLSSSISSSSVSSTAISSSTVSSTTTSSVASSSVTSSTVLSTTSSSIVSTTAITSTTSVVVTTSAASTTVTSTTVSLSTLSTVTISTTSAVPTATIIPTACTPGSFTCNSATTFSQCVPDGSGSGTYVFMGSVAPGTQCVDGSIVRQNAGACTPNGALQCNGETAFYLCDQGGLINMGPVAPGTACRDGVIVAL